MTTVISQLLEQPSKLASDTESEDKWCDIKGHVLSEVTCFFDFMQKKKENFEELTRTLQTMTRCSPLHAELRYRHEAREIAIVAR